MIDINIEKNRELYTDYNKCLELLRNIKMDDYEYPDGVTNFHVYTEVKTPKQLMVIKSYLATQNLDRTHLTVWSNYDINDNELIKPFKDYVTLKVYDAHHEAKGTVLENRNDWLTAADDNHWMQSGILRFLVPYKYGGVWADMDVIFFRDFKPILDQEWAYMWGSEYDFEGFGPCAAMMNIHKNSEHANICLDQITKTKVQPKSTCLDHALLAEVYKRRKFTVFPSVFFDTEWQINKKDPGIGTAIESGWFKENEWSHYIFNEAFAWHWHNTSYKNHIPEPGSKFAIWQQLIDNKLKQKNIL